MKLAIGHFAGRLLVSINGGLCYCFNFKHYKEAHGGGEEAAPAKAGEAICCGKR